MAFVCRLYTIRRLRGEKKETKTFLCSSSNLGPRSEMTQSDSDHEIRAWRFVWNTAINGVFVLCECQERHWYIDLKGNRLYGPLSNSAEPVLPQETLWDVRLIWAIPLNSKESSFWFTNMRNIFLLVLVSCHGDLIFWFGLWVKQIGKLETASGATSMEITVHGWWIKHGATCFNLEQSSALHQ